MDKIKKWDHLAIRPSTFEEFRKLKNEFKFPGLRSDDYFLKELIKIYRMEIQNV